MKRAPIINAIAIDQLEAIAIQERHYGHCEADAAGQMSTLAARHYGAAICIAELIDSKYLDSIVEQYKEDKKQ